MERLIEEIEEFEDLLKDSIRESLSAKEKEVNPLPYLCQLLTATEYLYLITCQHQQINCILLAIMSLQTGDTEE